ncbi:LysR family transcriptional regulator [Pseudomonas sp. RIT-PI-S]|uniref:LysR family transcriptional regulator n=1 Tax=Pseudomonas sp. RIT-PI-S TaxID=3035295 RepID=UPI0021DAB7B5|nr:LysR family transcriptional regulator [Pseudomonas sp. RIT-PI-S]
MDKMTALAMFVATADHGGFSRAAEHLGKTPSALAKAIAQLEADVGARLFERTTRRMTLTEAGHVYLAGTRQALMHLQLASEEVEHLQQALRGTLKVSAPPSFAPAFLSAVCCRFLEEYPAVRLQVDLSDDFTDLIEGGYDLALRDGPVDLPGVIAQPVLNNTLLLCAAPAYLARKPLPVTLDTYQAHDWLVFRHPLLDRHFWWVEHNGARVRAPQPAPRLASDNYDFLLSCLLAGQGLQFLPQWSAQPYLDRGELVELAPGNWRDDSAFGPAIHVMFLPHRRNTRKVKVFIDVLKAHFRAQGLA